jgi:type IV secretion system protein VirB5
MAAPDIEHPYLAARNAWQERYGSLITQARNWRGLAFGALAVAFVSTALALYLTIHNPFTPVVIPMDAFGRTVGGGVAKQLTEEQRESTRNGLIHAFIYDMRTVTSDEVAQQQAITRVYSRMKSGSAAHTVLSDHYRAHSPFEQAKNQIVNVQVNSILHTSPETYEATWRETTRERSSSEVSSTTRWRAVFTVQEGKPKTDADAWLNPMGMFVSNMNIAQVQEDK